MGRLCDISITHSPSLRLLCLWIHERYISANAIVASPSARVYPPIILLVIRYVVHLTLGIQLTHAAT